jgi:hypothetical protein
MSERIYTSKDNDGNSIFVFGSNLAGIHGAGAALEAKRHWGAKQSIGVGRTGMAYAIPTKDHNIQTRSLLAIQFDVKMFLEYARLNPDLTFLVTKIGCGLAGINESEIAPMFANAAPNCILPDGWRNFRNKLMSDTIKLPHQHVDKDGYVLLVKCLNRDGTSYDGFIWPKAGPVEPLKWSRTPDCDSGGLFGWPWGIGLAGRDPDACASWIVFRAKPENVIDLTGKAKAVPGENKDLPEVVYYGTQSGAMAFTMSGRMEFVTSNASGSASQTGYRGSASQTGDRGSACQTGDSGSASQTGDRGSASQTGDSGSASQTGDSGSASQTGDRGSASQTGDRGSASQTGDRGSASQTGYSGSASQTGYSGSASQTGYSGSACQTGDRGSASQTGDSGSASQTGDSGSASQTGYSGSACQTGDSGSASQTGYSGSACQTGYRGSASQTGDSGSASQTGDSGSASQTGYSGSACQTGDRGSAEVHGEQSCAVALGIAAKAKGKKGCWLTLCEWREIGGKWNRIDCQTKKVDGEMIKADTWYQLKAGKFVEMK